VHVIGPEHEAVFNLSCPGGPVELRENYGFLLRHLRRIEQMLNAYIDRLCEGWEQIHGRA
jgi:hypothetical protein